MAQKSNMTESHDTCLKPPQRNPPQWLHQVGCLKLVSTREWGMLACICMSPSLQGTLKHLIDLRCELKIPKQSPKVSFAICDGEGLCCNIWNLRFSLAGYQHRVKTIPVKKWTFFFTFSKKVFFLPIFKVHYADSPKSIYLIPKSIYLIQ